MGHDVFISYSTKDKAVANSLVRYLEERAIQCWIAPRDIPGGKEYAAVIVDAIKSAKAVVVVFSRFSQESSWVKGEVNRAMSTHRAIIPVKIDDAVPEGEMELYLGNRHWVEASARSERDFDNIRAAVVESMTATKGDATSFLNALFQADYGAKRGVGKWKALALSLAAVLGISLSTLAYSVLQDKIAVGNIIDIINRADAQAETKPWDPVLVNDHDIAVAREKYGERAFKRLSSASRSSDHGAQYYLGRCYEMGLGTATNDEVAIKLLWMAGSHGVERAYKRLKQKYLRGEGVERSELMAAVIDEKAGFSRQMVKQAREGLARENQHVEMTSCVAVSNEETCTSKAFPASCVDRTYAQRQRPSFLSARLKGSLVDSFRTNCLCCKNTGRLRCWWGCHDGNFVDDCLVERTCEYCKGKGFRPCPFCARFRQGENADGGVERNGADERDEADSGEPVR